MSADEWAEIRALLADLRSLRDELRGNVDDGPILTDEDFERIGPVQDLSTIPAVTDEIMAGLVAEITYVLEREAGTA